MQHRASALLATLAALALGVAVHLAPPPAAAASLVEVNQSRSHGHYGGGFGGGYGGPRYHSPPRYAPPRRYVPPPPPWGYLAPPRFYYDSYRGWHSPPREYRRYRRHHRHYRHCDHYGRY